MPDNFMQTESAEENSISINKQLNNSYNSMMGFMNDTNSIRNNNNEHTDNQTSNTNKKKQSKKKKKTMNRKLNKNSPPKNNAKSEKSGVILKGIVG
jgi:hypothetical protein